MYEYKTITQTLIGKSKEADGAINAEATDGWRLVSAVAGDLNYAMLIFECGVEAE